MSHALLLILTAQVASAAPAAEPLAVSARASARILAPQVIAFEDFASVAEARPEAVQLRKDGKGTLWLEFS